MIPHFPNEMGPGNPVTALDLRTKDGTTIRWVFDEPIQQSRMMMAMGRLFANLGLEEMPAIELPEPDD